jgi:hypothetical protein
MPSGTGANSPDSRKGFLPVGRRNHNDEGFVLRLTPNRLRWTKVVHMRSTFYHLVRRADDKRLGYVPPYRVENSHSLSPLRERNIEETSTCLPVVFLNQFFTKDSSE